MKMILAALAALFLLPASANAQVSTDHARAWDAHERGGTSLHTQRRASRHTRATKRRASVARRLSPPIARSPIARIAHTASQILPHPSGCPRRLFCGCGAALEVFGKHRRDLWLAAAWLRFPSASPGPGMVAANRRHVMVIRQMVGPNTALVYDANSGGGKTRLHVRSLAGYSVRNPRA